MIDGYELDKKIWEAENKGEEYQMTQEEFEFVAMDFNFTREEMNEIYKLNHRRQSVGKKLEKIGTGGVKAGIGILALSAFGASLTMLSSLMNPPKDKEFDMFDKSMAVLASQTKDSKLLNEIEHLRAERQTEAKAAVQKHNDTQTIIFKLGILGAAISGIGITVGITGSILSDHDISYEKERANKFLVYNRRFKQKQ